MTDSQEENPENIFRILLATDNHLGYGEANMIRESDTFNTFEEILQIAVRENVDFILLGGDLFHEARPSPYCFNKCIELIRKYCLGDKAVEIEFLSDPSYNFTRSMNPVVNYEDPNLNVSIPIFSIHGNHDDPTGKKQTSAMDLMSSMGFINYFGRVDNLQQVEINPILLKKGNSQLALYGLSHIRDERLARLFLEKKVIMKVPENVDQWFNLLVLHQNRANRGVKNFIPETFIPDFMDLVVWGHEHDCQIEAKRVANGDVFITQPGSSVATSLAEGEALEKKVAVLSVKGSEFNITPIGLQTVRPFIFKHIVLDPIEDVGLNVKHDEITKVKVKKIIEEMIEEARTLKRKNDPKPLIRLVVKYQDERQVFNPIRFGQTYAEKVANPEDILKFASLQKREARRRVYNKNEDENMIEDGETINRVEDLLPKYFNETNKLTVLSVTGMGEAVKRFIDANDTEAPTILINYQYEKTLEKMKELRPEEDEVVNCLEDLRAVRERELDEFQRILNNPRRPRQSNHDDDVVMIDDDDDDDDSESNSNSGPVRRPTVSGSRGGKGSRGGRGSRGARGAKK